MKILAIIDVLPGAAMESVRAELTNELKGSWTLFASGVLREAYATATPTRVVFVLEAEDVAHAEQHLRKLPLIAEHSGDPDQPFQAIPITHSDRSRSVWRGVREGSVGCIS
jgi:hypothetical protein